MSNRSEVFVNLADKFKTWLEERGVDGLFAASTHYVANLKAIGEPIQPHAAKGAAWNGFYELLTGDKPNVGVFEVTSLGAFSANYGKAVSFFTVEKKAREQVRLLYPNCAIFDDLYDFAYESTKGDGGHTKHAFVKYCQFLCELEAQVNTGSNIVSAQSTRQRIIYGAPGTGKSFGLNTDTADDENVFRVTFHPDSDYASFVGAYKPTMDAVPRMAMNGVQVELATFDPAIGADDLAKIRNEKRVAYEFVPQAFMNAYVAAWKNYATAGAGTSPKDVFLIIEEINRGNCAQVFGDIFQLLDRSDAGWSTYPVLADHDLGKWLGEKHFGTAAFAALANVPAPDKIKASDWDEIRKGKMLLLPPNLYIWATMNTSDQSLFPIDSAFKRRWDWKYVPIREGKYRDGPKQGQKLNWKIRFSVPQPLQNGQPVADKLYNFDWWEFLKNINEKIFKTTESEDKKLGYFFVKPDGEDAQTHDGTISADRFVGKVVFYLWNDVFKDYGIETIFKNDEGKASESTAKGVEFQAFFDDEDDKVNADTLLKFFKHIELKSDEEKAAANQQGQNANP